MTFKRLRRTRDQAASESGVPIKPHDFRRHHGSLVAARFGPHVAAEQLGHGVQVSLLAYQRAMPGQDREVADFLDQQGRDGGAERSIL